MTRHIVVGVDGSASAAAAVEWAAADAQRRGLAVLIVHVCEPWSFVSEGTQFCEGVLEAAADRALALTRDVVVETRLTCGDVVGRLLGESASADSVVLGSRGLGGFAGMITGSVGMAVAGHAAGPVVIVRRTPVLQHGIVVVGDDGSEHSDAAIEYAVEQARARGVPLRVVFAWQAPVVSPYTAAYNALLEEVYEQQGRLAAERVTPWREKNPDVQIVDQQAPGHPVNVLVQAGDTADLLVMGSHGRGGLASAVLGSVSHAVLHRQTCPIAVVRPRAASRPAPAPARQTR
jgi:nucleotide-binding universal stress UspA family protein